MSYAFRLVANPLYEEQVFTMYNVCVLLITKLLLIKCCLQKYSCWKSESLSDWTKNQTFDRGTVALLKSLSWKCQKYHSGVKFVLLPNIETFVKIEVE